VIRILRSIPFCVVAVLLIHAGLLAWGASLHSPAIDEVAHLPSGLSHWQLGRFDLYSVNPPLVRMTAALPVLAVGPKTDWKKIDQPLTARAEFEIGQDFMVANGMASFWYFTLARWACIPFSILGGAVCFCWARRLYGNAAGFLALVLWCFCPIVLAFGQTITPDVAATAMGLTAAYSFWCWIREPSWSGAFWAGLFLGLAELTKMTWVVLFPLWPILWVICRWPIFKRERWREPGQLLLIVCLGVYVINLGYAFDDSCQRLGDFEFVSQPLRGPEAAFVGNRFSGTWLADVPIPVPKYFLLGMDLQKRDLELEFFSYLRGEWRRSGWWYYYVYGLAMKVPLGTWILAVFTLVLSVFTRRFSAGWRDELILLAPVVVVLGFVSSQTGFNHHVRYVLPALPYIFVWLGKSAAAASQGGWKTRSFVGTAVLWTTMSSLWIYPHSMSYFNELAGGPKNGHAHFVDSNIDWGQDLLLLKRWLDDHPEAQSLHLAYFGGFDPRVAGMEFTLPAKGAIGADGAVLPPPKLAPGYYAVSVSLLRGMRFTVFDGQGGREHLVEPYFAYFIEHSPVARVGFSIYIYRIEP
jgi:4-amino-4-deoxy-L-arabinose transferase-like glycosyltransferase